MGTSAGSGCGDVSVYLLRLREAPNRFTPDSVARVLAGGSGVSLSCDAITEMNKTRTEGRRNIELFRHRGGRMWDTGCLPAFHFMV